MKTLWQNCHVASMAQGTYSIIEDAAIVTVASKIDWIGPRAELPAADYPTGQRSGRGLGDAGADRLPHPHGVRRQPQR